MKQNFKPLGHTMANLNHTIKIEELEKWASEKKVLYARSRTVYQQVKRLIVTLKGYYEVYLDDNLVLATAIGVDAVNKYNQL